MTVFLFNRQNAIEAIALTERNGREWLYQEYPAPGGQMRRSTTGFIMHEGKTYPVKPLGRLASKVAGRAMTSNPVTDAFRRHFERLGFQLIDSPQDEAEAAAERQRSLATVWSRPRQADFRRKVFNLFGACCLITRCETLVALEAAHILPVAKGGSDEGWNGIPLRADMHRLFDAGSITIDPRSLKIFVADVVRPDYRQYHDLDIEPILPKATLTSQIIRMLTERSNTI